MNTVFYYDPIFMEHDTGPHPERPERLTAILDYLKKTYGDALNVKSPGKAGKDDLTCLHPEAYLTAVEGMCKRGGGFLDGDTPVSPRSFEAALHAAGAMKDGADDLMEGRASSVFALVRPPGHHARPAAGMGFCLINNVAVAAEYMKRRYGLERILIADFDVHHGNGTQEMFYRDGSVFFLSVHRYPFYPGTGSAEETGTSLGAGATLNLPIRYGQPPEEYVGAFASALDRAAERHKPQVLIVSAGFDAFHQDPIAGCGLLPEHYHALGRAVRETADACAEGRVLSSLEGGYSLGGLPLCLDAYVKGLN